MIISNFVDMNNGPQSSLIVMLRVGKLLSLFKLTSVLRGMFQTVTLAMPSVVNLALLFFIVNFIFAIVGVYLFADVKLQDEGLTEHANFQIIWRAFLLVFRMSTFDAWGYIMHDMLRTHSQYFYCVYNPTYTDFENNDMETIGCGTPYAAIYAIICSLVVAFMFLNLFLVIVVSSMLEITALSESVLNDEVLERYEKCWKKYDPNVRNLIIY